MLHLEERAPGWANGFAALRPGATLFVEDLVLGPDASEDHVELARAVLDAPALVDPAAYAAELEAAGFVDVACSDLSEDWRAWTAERYDQFIASRALHVRTHGVELFESRRIFLEVMRDLFAHRALGGARLTARKRGALEADLGAWREGHLGLSTESLHA